MDANPNGKCEVPDQSGGTGEIILNLTDADVPVQPENGLNVLDVEEESWNYFMIGQENTLRTPVRELNAAVFVPVADNLPSPNHELLELGNMETAGVISDPVSGESYVTMFDTLFADAEVRGFIESLCEKPNETPPALGQPTESRQENIAENESEPVAHCSYRPPGLPRTDFEGIDASHAKPRSRNILKVKFEELPPQPHCSPTDNQGKGVSQNKDSKSTTTRRVRTPVPDELKDEAYWIRRKRNTEATRRFRNKEKTNVDKYLRKKKADLEAIVKLKKSIAKLKKNIRKEKVRQKHLLKKLKRFATWDSDSSSTDDTDTTASTETDD